MKTKILSILGFLLVCALVLAQQVMAADAVNMTSDKGLAAIGIGLAIGLSALGTGLAQSRIGPAGLGSGRGKT